MHVLRPILQMFLSVLPLPVFTLPDCSWNASRQNSNQVVVCPVFCEFLDKYSQCDRKVNQSLKCEVQPEPLFLLHTDTDLAAVPAEAVGEAGCGGALLVHQQQTGKQPLQLQGNHSDLQGK